MYNIILCTALACAATCLAQLPQRLAVDVRVYEDDVPINGQHHLLIRWYDRMVGGDDVVSESFDVAVIDGHARILLGTTADIPHDLLRSGNAWLGVSVDGRQELKHRTMLVSVPYAHHTEHATVADRLAEDVTGVVTSLNELGGAVKVLGEGGIVVRNDGDALLISNSQALESGIIHGNDKQHVFVISPRTKISPSCRVTSYVVSPTTTITCGIASVDVEANTISIITSAAMTRDESIHWFLLETIPFGQ